MRTPTAPEMIGFASVAMLGGFATSLLVLRWKQGVLSKGFKPFVCRTALDHHGFETIMPSILRLCCSKWETRRRRSWPHELSVSPLS